MLSKIITASINGMDVEKVTVETDFSQGLPCLSLVGLPDATVRESKERIRSAIINSGYVFPLKRITVNLSPADTRKTGSHFDLPMAVGILSSMGLFDRRKTRNAAFIGELSLDGTINPVESCLALVMGLKEHGVEAIYLPAGNTAELIHMEDINVYPVSSFTEMLDILADMKDPDPVTILPSGIQVFNDNDFKDYSDVRGQENGKRAMQISAAGWHDVMMTGPPGAGKTMLASRLGSIIPSPSKEELMEITKIHSIAGEKIPGSYKGNSRPFRSPHHTATPVSMMGGGYNSKPGELSLAHRGILFLDELPEFERKVLDMLRQPLEDGYVNLTRLAARHRYPCSFILVAAMNPCPCGYYGDHAHECICNTAQRMRYVQKVSGPLKDRIDLHVRINPVDHRKVVNNKNLLSSDDLKESVLAAAEIQRERYGGMNFSYNSQIPDGMIDKYCNISKGGSDLLKTISISMDLSARAVSRTKKVSRTIADLEGNDIITDLHVAEAVSYRSPEELS